MTLLSSLSRKKKKKSFLSRISKEDFPLLRQDEKEDHWEIIEEETEKNMMKR